MDYKWSKFEIMLMRTAVVDVAIWVAVPVYIFETGSSGLPLLILGPIICSNCMLLPLTSLGYCICELHYCVYWRTGKIAWKAFSCFCPDIERAAWHRRGKQRPVHVCWKCSKHCLNYFMGLKLLKSRWRFDAPAPRYDDRKDVKHFNFNISHWITSKPALWSLRVHKHGQHNQHVIKAKLLALVKKKKALGIVGFLHNCVVKPSRPGWAADRGFPTQLPRRLMLGTSVLSVTSPALPSSCWTPWLPVKTHAQTITPTVCCAVRCSPLNTFMPARLRPTSGFGTWLLCVFQSNLNG